MKCAKCGDEFDESELQYSHDVPCYMFDGATRKIRKQQADKFGRHFICKKCHDIYEKCVFASIFRSLDLNTRLKLRGATKKFSERYFRGQENDT